MTASTEGPRIDVVGAALDDRGLARIQFLQGGKVVAEQDLLASGDTLARYQRFEHTFELAEGANDIKVVVLDTGGTMQEQSFLVTRNLLLYQRPWFLPSALASAAALVGLGFAAQRPRRRRAVRSRFNPYIAGAPVHRRRHVLRPPEAAHPHPERPAPQQPDDHGRAAHREDDVPPPPEEGARSATRGRSTSSSPSSPTCRACPRHGFFHAVMTDVVEALALAAGDARAPCASGPSDDDATTAATSATTSSA